MVVYHLFPTVVTGGYVGVDVFFVISGFLITAHLHREMARTGTISLRSFYARRIRRLLPAALVVLVASLGAMFIWIPTTGRAGTVQEIFASATYWVNWLLARNAVDYSASNNASSLVQHFWSLSVEEQFYAVWPVLILLAVVVRRPVRPLRRLVVVVGAITAASLIFSIVETSLSPASAYFVTPARVWEFGIGAGLALLSISRPVLAFLARARSAGWLAAATIAGLLMIAIAVISFDEKTVFPGPAALVPVIGTALVIFGGSSQATGPISSILRARPIQYLGGISYAIYLWHWPLIVLYPIIRGNEIGIVGALTVLTVTVVLAALTKRFIEDPAREGFLARSNLRAFAFAGIGILLIAALCSIQVAKDASDAQRYEQIIQQLESGDGDCVGAAAMDGSQTCPHPFAVTETVLPDYAITHRADIGECQQSQAGTAIVSCTYGDTTDPVATIAVVGDSHAAQYLPALDTVATERHWKIESFAKSSCPVSFAVRFQVNAACVEWSSAVVERLASDSDIDLIVYTNSTAVYSIDTSEPNLLTADDLDDSIGALAGAGHPLVVLRDPPGTHWVDVGCIAGSPLKNDPCATDRSLVVTQDILVTAAADHDVQVIDNTRFFCDDLLCHAVIGGLVVYGDAYGHMTTTFAKTLGPYLAVELETALSVGRQ